MALNLPPRRFATWLGLGVLSVAVLWILGPVLVPFAVAAVFAYALHPLVLRLQALSGHKLPRLLCVVWVEFLALSAGVGVVLLLVPILTREIPLLQQQVPVLLDQLAATVNPALAQWGWHLTLDVGSLKSQLIKYLSANREDWLEPLISSLKLGGSFALALLGNVVLMPVVLFYLLNDWDRWVSTVTEWVPPAWRPAYDRFVIESDQVLGQYLRGQLLVMFALAVVYATALRLFGLDLALPIGVFTGLAVFVPYLGFGLGLMLALLAGVLQFAFFKALLMVAVVFGAGQILESFWLTPRWVGERIGLHPLAVIFALLAFGQLFGFVGILVALPVSAVLLVAMRRLKKNYFASDLYRGPQA